MKLIIEDNRIKHQDENYHFFTKDSIQALKNNCGAYYLYGVDTFLDNIINNEADITDVFNQLLELLKELENRNIVIMSLVSNKTDENVITAIKKCKYFMSCTVVNNNNSIRDQHILVFNNNIGISNDYI